MTDPTQWLATNYPLVALVVLMLGGPAGVRKGLEWWAKRRDDRAAKELDAEKEVRLAKIAAEERGEKREERTADRLWDRLDVLDQRLDDCEDKHRKAERAAEDCERRSTDLEQKLDALRGMALRSDDTGQFRTGLLQWASEPPPKPLDHLPPVKRPKETT